MSALALFLLQIAVIVLVTGMCGVLLGKLGQPRVVGEMLGGIFLGRSVFGYAMPHLIANLFPLGSLHDLSLVSELGMVLYLFLEGMKLILIRVEAATDGDEDQSALHGDSVSLGSGSAW